MPKPGSLERRVLRAASCQTTKVFLSCEGTTKIWSAYLFSIADPLQSLSTCNRSERCLPRHGCKRSVAMQPQYLLQRTRPGSPLNISGAAGSAPRNGAGRQAQERAGTMPDWAGSPCTAGHRPARPQEPEIREIGRASCRERVCQYV